MGIKSWFSKRKRKIEANQPPTPEEVLLALPQLSPDKLKAMRASSEKYMSDQARLYLDLQEHEGNWDLYQATILQVTEAVLKKGFGPEVGQEKFQELLLSISGRDEPPPRVQAIDSPAESLRALDAALECVRRGQAMPSPDTAMKWATTANALAGCNNKEVSRRAIELINEELAGLIGCGHIRSPRALPMSKLSEIRRLSHTDKEVAIGTFIAFTGADREEAATLIAALARTPK